MATGTRTLASASTQRCRCCVHRIVLCVSANTFSNGRSGISCCDFEMQSPDLRGSGMDNQPHHDSADVLLCLPPRRVAARYGTGGRCRRTELGVAFSECGSNRLPVGVWQPGVRMGQRRNRHGVIANRLALACHQTMARPSRNTATAKIRPLVSRYTVTIASSAVQTLDRIHQCRPVCR